MEQKTLKALEYDKIIDKLYSLATSEMGKEMAKKLLPTSDAEYIIQALQETEEAVNIINIQGDIPLNGFRDIRKELKMSKVGSILNSKQFLNIKNTLKTCRELKKFKNIIQKRNLQYNNIFKKIDNLYDLKDIEYSISNCIDEDGSILDEASSNLKKIRRNINIYNNRIKDVLENIIRSPKYHQFLQESIITIRNNRYVVPLKSECKGSIKGIVHDQSASGATLFVEPATVVELNNKLNELYAEENKEIEKILLKLTGIIKDSCDFIQHNIEILQLLDIIFAKAKLAIEMQAVKPVINTNMQIDIKAARHPLIPKDSVVPIDISLGKDFNILLITGPNTGGKTVALKTLGLLVLMVQTGMFIPAKQGSQIPIFKKIFADIGDEQSIEQSLSTFSAHMNNIITIIKNADKSSLVLLDELGAGTDPEEGSALAMAILDYLYNVNALTVATTHYSELKKYALKKKGIENAAVEFDIDTLRPTYKLIIGLAGKSNAFYISEKLGLDSIIVDNARKLLSTDKIRFEDVLNSLEENKKRSELQLNDAIKLKKQAEELKQEYIRKLEHIEQYKKKIIQQARYEASQILMDAKQNADKIVKELRSIKHDMQNRVNIDNKRIEHVRNELNNKIKKLNTQIVESNFDDKNVDDLSRDIKQGDSVYLINLQKKGIVLTPPDLDNRLTVQVGILKVKVHTSEIKLIDDSQQELQKTLSVTLNKDRKISNQIDVRGKQLDEALAEVDKYLDECVLAGLNEVVIIHGKGAGILRQGIRNNIKNNPHVKKFRSGKYGEGESGVTIVSLK